MSLLLWLLGAAVAAFVVACRVAAHRWRLIDNIHGPRTVPGFGNALQTLQLRHPIETMQHRGDPKLAEERQLAWRATSVLAKWEQLYKPVFRIWLGPLFPLLVVTHPVRHSRRARECAAELCGRPRRRWRGDC
jgi:hypothetical protein